MLLTRARSRALGAYSRVWAERPTSACATSHRWIDGILGMGALRTSAPIIRTAS
jgi:hypothetical protein